MNDVRLEILIREQCLHVFRGQRKVGSHLVSTAANGAGQALDSGCTPLGRHHVRLKIGAGCAPGAVFVARRPSGEIWSKELAANFPHRDWILTRILWLSGDQPGLNRGGHCDTLRRYIYIHGTPDTEPMGVPLSHGCIRMRNNDILALFEQIENGARVDIIDTSSGGW